MNVLTNFKEIKAFVLDVDGVLTDGMLISLLLRKATMCLLFPEVVQKQLNCVYKN